MTDRRDCIVVGAGPAGLGVAACLTRSGVDTLVVERGEAVAPAWRARYDGFRLNTSSWFSYLPGAHLPRSAGRWPSRDALVDYYDTYARERGLEVKLGTTVERIDRTSRGWCVRSAGTELDARSVVVATGKYNEPRIPDWPGRDEFGGELMHSCAYRNADPFRGRRVLVVGAGASAFEIATQLADGGAGEVWLSIRRPPHIIHRDIGPVPSDLFAVLGRRLPIPLVDAAGKAIRRVSLGDLSDYGLETPPDGIYTRVRSTGMIPTVDGPYLEAVKNGAVQVVAAVERMSADEVHLADGTAAPAEVVIAATGYERGLDPLVGHLGILDDDGRPRVHGARTAPHAPGLHFIGFTEPLSGNLRELRLDAKRIARAVTREL